MKIVYLFCFAALLAHAHGNNDLTHRPPSFPYGNDSAVFVDFEEARYKIIYDIPGKTASVHANLTMNVVEEGYPIFDLINEPTSIQINGVASTSQEVQTPAGETKVRVLGHKLPVGQHQLQIEVPLTDLIDFTDKGVKNAFWVTDLEDRHYLERYIPVNFEYDRVKMVFDIEFKGLGAPQHVFANGKVSWNGDRATIEFPDYFTVNSLYFHTTPVGSVSLMEFDFPSIGGRSIPVQIYNQGSGEELETFKAETIKVMKELEGDYGAFPHPSVTIYIADLSQWGLGGMEYAGATVTNLYALGHELFHSYFARGLVPANGNAGWIDEALASWRDNHYQRRTTLTGSSGMASQSIYTRKTDTAAYTFGARFMAFLDGKFADKGGLKPFMNDLLSKKLFTPIFTEDFIHEMEKFFGEEVSSTFQTFVYRSPLQGQQKPISVMTHAIHRKLNPKKMGALL